MNERERERKREREREKESETIFSFHFELEFKPESSSSSFDVVLKVNFWNFDLGIIGRRWYPTPPLTINQQYIPVPTSRTHHGGGMRLGSRFSFTITSLMLN